MRSAFLLLVFLTIMFAGASTPFVFGIGYLWVDLFTPNKVAYSLLSQLPVALIMAVATFGSYIILDRKQPPRLTFTLVMVFVWAGWITFTTTTAVLPGHAWTKWDWAFKAILFSTIFPFLFRSRVQIEAMLLTMVFSLSGAYVAFGIKALLSGGGYSISLGLVSGNSGLAESSTLALVVASILPVILYLLKHNIFFPKKLITKLLFIGLAVVGVMTVLGTHARTGLVALGILAFFYWLLSKHKIRTGLAAVIVGIGALFAADDSWFERMQTTVEYQGESSALGRIAVWKWTIEYVQNNPMGGGFGIYRISQYSVPIVKPDGEEDVLVIQGKAFHSIYFEVLGEQGYVGLAIFLLIVLSSLWSLWRVRSRAKKVPELQWVSDLATALIIAMMVYLAGGAFVGIAYQPYFYYYVACAISLQQYLRRTLEIRAAAETGENKTNSRIRRGRSGRAVRQG